ncbi:CdaR family protein [Aquibacillus sediminis]|uniref:CdaR family protein n=1 Tax=Aquibacillus sediminis TaxID=2574734 RepID=UPI001107FE80|nr:CdaR family protein [Aquibacillus sediminis]
MNDWLNKPWAIRLVSLLLAILIFIVFSFDTQKNRADDVGFDAIDSFFNSSQETRVVEDIPVDININEEQYVVSGVPQTVDVMLEGSVNIVASTATQRNFDVYVDLEDLKPGEHTVQLQHSGISDQIYADIEPSEIDIIIEEKATKEFDVKVDYINEDLLGPEFEIEEAVVDPSTVMITSAESVVDQIAVVKAFIDLEGVNGPTDLEDVPVKVYDNQGNELNVRVQPSTVDVSVHMVSPNKKVPVNVETQNELQGDMEISSIVTEPGEITVFADEEVLNELNHISTEAIDLASISEDGTMEVNLSPPSDVRKISPEQVTVELQLQTIEERNLSNIPIEVNNLSNNYSLSFIEPTQDEMEVTVTGASNQIENLSETDIRLSIDVQDQQPGEYTFPIEVTGPDNITVDPQFNQITVRID